MRHFSFALAVHALHGGTFTVASEEASAFEARLYKAGKSAGSKIERPGHLSVAAAAAEAFGRSGGFVAKQLRGMIPNP